MKNKKINRNNLVDFLLELVPEFINVIESGDYCDRDDGVYVIIGAVSNRFNVLQKKNITKKIENDEINELEHYYNFINFSAIMSNDKEVENIIAVSFFENLDNDDKFINNMLSKLNSKAKKIFYDIKEYWDRYNAWNNSKKVSS